MTMGRSGVGGADVLVVLDRVAQALVDVLALPERIAVHRDEVHLAGQGRSVIAPPDVVVGHGDRLGHLCPDLAHVPKHLLLAHRMGRPLDQDLVADVHGHHDVVVLVGEADAVGDLPRVALLGPRLAREPDPEHDPEAESLAPDHLEHVLAVPIRGVHPDQPPVPRQDVEVLCNLLARGMHVAVRALPFAVTGVRDSGAPPLVAKGPNRVHDASCLRRALASGRLARRKGQRNQQRQEQGERSHVGSPFHLPASTGGSVRAVAGGSRPSFPRRRSSSARIS